ncbi:MAG: hypothetical protein SGBAC_011467 [Bacillariaceae sp.]
MKASVGNISMLLISTILCLLLSSSSSSSIPSVDAAHPWVSTRTSQTVTSTTGTTSKRRFSTTNPLAVRPTSSFKTKKKKPSKQEEENADAETKPPPRWSFFSRSSDNTTDETEETAESVEEKEKDKSKSKNKSKKPSWKETRKPKVDENDKKKKKRRFVFRNKASKNESTTQQETKDETALKTTKTTKTKTKTSDESSKDESNKDKTETETETPKRKSRFQRAREAKQERRQKDKEEAANASNATISSEESTTLSNATSTADEVKDESTSANKNNNSNNKNNNNSTSISNTTSANTTTIQPFGVQPRRQQGTGGIYQSPIIYQHRPYPAGRPNGMDGSPTNFSNGMMPTTNNSALVVAAIASVLGVASRLWLVMFISKKLAWDAEEMLPPVQHFVWECLNDKYSKDVRIFRKALSKPPLGFTKRQWKKFQKQEQLVQKIQRKQAYLQNQQKQETAMIAGNNNNNNCTEEEDNLLLLETSTNTNTNTNTTPNNNSSNENNPIMSILRRKDPNSPTQTTIVVDLTPNFEQLNISYLSNIVNLLIQSHYDSVSTSTSTSSSSISNSNSNSNNNNSNSNNNNNNNNNYNRKHRRIVPTQTEVVLLLTSPGGAVTTYGLAAAQVARLENAGIRTTICVDHIAASGGYMIASQTSQIIAAPFAMVGSIGVIQEGLNFNKLLEKYGVKPLIIKAGEHKNPISQFGHVSDKDLKEEAKRMEGVHESFIELCTSNRPSLDPAVCDGTVLLASRALESGLVDRILTSDEYLWERICAGDHVLQLHRTSRTDHRRIFARALDLLPHLKERIQGMNLQKVIGHLVQGYAFFSMVRNQFPLDSKVPW